MGEPAFYTASFPPGANGNKYHGIWGINDALAVSNKGDIIFARDSDDNDAGANQSGPIELTFCLPIYSGILGVLMPDKKLLPLSLMPLEVEFTLNPHAFYAVGTSVTNRDFKVTRFEIYTHMLQFE